jgi:hypothetical protein
METAWYTISNGQHVQHHVGGYGNEPSDIQIFKTYAVFFERDGADVADIDVTVKDLDCGTGSIGLGYDWSRDNKSMVALSSALSAGKALCVDLYGYHVPAGETRTVVLVAYYSAQTSMR